MADMKAKGRHHMNGRESCPNGHDITLPGALKTVRSANREYRACKECARERSRRYVARRAAIKAAGTAK